MKSCCPSEVASVCTKCASVTVAGESVSMIAILTTALVAGVAVTAFLALRRRGLPFVQARRLATG